MDPTLQQRRRRTTVALVIDDKPDRKGSDGVDWDAYRVRIRRRYQKRANAAIAAVIFVVGLVVVAMKIVEPQVYPLGDLRNEIWFRLAVGGFLVGIAAIVLVVSLRRLRAQD